MTGLILAFVGVFVGGMVLGLIIRNKGFHFHKWLPWTFYQDNNIYAPGKRTDDALPIRRTKTYTRVCSKCNLPETREIEA